jgi:beta-lactamase superfamily II metal-dependent hydrolase
MLAMKPVLVALALLAAAVPSRAAKHLEIYCVDVEGGQATLMVAPSGESMLVDTGYGGFNRRDAERIAAAAKAAGVKRIDYLVITHFHSDHVGGVAQLAEKLPIRHFIDHGTTVETGQGNEVLFRSYAAERAKGQHTVVKPGDTIPIKDLDVRVVAAAGQSIGAPLAGAGAHNPSCADFQKQADEKGENSQSIGLIVQYGSFRLADLGDLTWNKEHDLVCPNNKLGRVDLFIVSHHARLTSNSPQLVAALAPKAAIIPNGAKKGGDPEGLKIIKASPGLQEVWQLHYSVAGGQELNTSDAYIANLNEVCEGKWLKVTAMKDGTFTVENSRNKHQKTYGK